MEQSCFELEPLQMNGFWEAITGIGHNSRFFRLYKVREARGSCRGCCGIPIEMER